MTHAIDLGEFANVLAGSNGLIIGPTVTLHSGITHDIQAALSVPSGVQGYWPSIAAAGGKDKSATQRELLALFTRTPAGAAVGKLAEGSWSAVLSLSHDVNFESQYRLFTSKSRPHRHPITVVEELARPLPQRITPVFKLLGQPIESRLIVDATQLLLRRVQWRAAVKAFCDTIRGGTVVCVGLDETSDLFQELLVDFAREPTTRPKNFIFLGDDPLVRATSPISALIGSFSRLVNVQGTLASLPIAIAQSQSVSRPRPLSIQETTSQPLAHYARVVSLVNEHRTPLTSRTEQHRLLDELFSPHLASWDPFAHNLDFPRTTAGLLFQSAVAYFSSTAFRSSAIALTGSAASGKTVLLKRLAYDLADKSRFVLWLKPALGLDASQLLKEVFRKIRTVFNMDKVVVVMDDPTSFMALTPRDVALAARNTSLEILLVVAARTSEWQVRDSKDFIGPLPLHSEHVLPDHFDDAELALMPDYLVSLNLYPDTSRARTAMSAISRSSDTLSTLYFLLNETKSVISNSIKDEYFRLGDVTGLSKIVIGQVERTSELLREAYELVGVSNFHRVLLPIEVLVSALDVPYSDWLLALPPEGSAWGLLYPNDDPRTDGAAYSTRNDVVTRLLVQIVNGGSISHSGEIKALHALLSACTGTSILYREFCVKLLVNNHALDAFDYSDVIRLYDTAIQALPAKDRTILHHKAICMRTRGNDPAGALRVLEEALATPHYPYAAQSEPDQHIHNSIARAYSDLQDQGQIDLETAMQGILEHLQLSRSAEFHNYFAAHVHADAILKLLGQLPKEREADRDTLAARALSDLENTLSSIKNTFETDATVASEDVVMLEAARTKLIMRARPLQETTDSADNHWIQFRNQDGYVMGARLLLEEARASNKGYSFRDAYEYADKAIQRVRIDGSEPSAALAEAAVQIYYTWRVTRRIPTKSQPNDIDWEKIVELSTIALRANRGGQDVHLRYLQAFALSHQGKWAHAESVFHSLRQLKIPYSILWLTRDYLLDEYGSVRRLQGEIRRSHDRTYLHAAELGTDFVCSRNHQWPRTGEVAHSFVRFHYGGPTAYPLSELGG